MPVSIGDERFGRMEYRGWKQSVLFMMVSVQYEIIIVFVRQSSKLVHSFFQTRAHNDGKMGGSAIYELETKVMNDLITANKMVDMLFIFNNGIYSQKPILLHI